MANLTFYYSTMNAGKTIDLIKTAFNYKTENIPISIFTSNIDTRSGKNKVKSRMGMEEDAISIKTEDNLYEIVKTQKTGVVLVDEVQFFTIEHIWELFQIAHKLDIPVVCYGLRGDFRGNPFPASAQLMAIANKVEELRSICFCGTTAIINARIVDGKIVSTGEQIVIGGNESYKPLCAKHWLAGQYKKEE